MSHLKYLLYVLRHKYYVFIECCRIGIMWRGITHDLSKFSRAEWTPYVRRFYGDGNNACFNDAWKHHYQRNDHHWNYWNCGNSIRFMSNDAMKEMVADWCAMSRVMGGSAAEYYEKNKKNIKIHSYQQQYLAGLLLEYGQIYYKKSNRLPL